ncbi:uncharacterized protein BDR25DRAFT_363134 [Lindgomyces ingoldianus]|uniref:Uncharacterized protein n=1 Tax=Lindgomyces ingoldianus TaxID=673940 RepID=A0ACB6Q9K4_9PLEO|nr:uncharacterized protein BDR25DRAFT_363134 [Lindgomyces ingoldianus]KAF2463047.1 hypothetical protein BDR25DRAFT_363134 [Lindgomyces ingoldianus]
MKIHIAILFWVVFFTGTWATTCTKSNAVSLLDYTKSMKETNRETTCFLCKLGAWTTVCQEMCRPIKRDIEIPNIAPRATQISVFEKQYTVNLFSGIAGQSNDVCTYFDQYLLCFSPSTMIIYDNESRVNLLTGEVVYANGTRTNIYSTIGGQPTPTSIRPTTAAISRATQAAGTASTALISPTLKPTQNSSSPSLIFKLSSFIPIWPLRAFSTFYQEVSLGHLSSR